MGNGRTGGGAGGWEHERRKGAAEGWPGEVEREKGGEAEAVLRRPVDQPARNGGRKQRNGAKDRRKGSRQRLKKCLGWSAIGSAMER